MIKLYTVAAVLATLAAAPAARPQMIAPPPPLRHGIKAPAFVTRTVSGKPLSLRSLRGKVVLLDFWATWCIPCRMATPTLEALHKEYHRRGLQVVGISLDDPRTVALVPSYVKHFGITYTVVAAPLANAQAAQSYNAATIPTQVLIDKRGVVRWSQAYFVPEEKQALSALIRKLLAEKA